ncbi:L-2-amino-thiazoline-4-carboxylic acid hydrolase, partial [Candidatus Bipolaricaulota bacterium]|nr:L-2-amino-thiazoline-4-carboxylic acid hydrolase [Candidatus Bipolaricaulota bacterium]
MTTEKLISIEEAAHEVALVSRRMALLHIAFARTLVGKLGDERGKELIIEAIRAYGNQIGNEVRAKVEQQGLEPTPENYGAGDARQLPSFGMHKGVEWSKGDAADRLRAYGCVMGQVWNELGESELGRLYCLVDPAKFMAFDGKHTLAHLKTIPDGDDYCEFCVRPVTDEEISAFRKSDPAWTEA